MKLNKILMVLAATAIVGCTSDDLNDFSATQAPQDSRLIQLDPNFALAGVGEGDAITRTHWEVASGSLTNKFLPILYDGTYAVDDPLDWHADYLKQSVGLCWLNETVGENVYTNYQFYHFGWLKKGETKATLECNELTNGAWYDEIKFTAAGSGSPDEEEADETELDLIDPVAKGFAIGDLNWNSGVYRTENKAIFGGDYIVYYPFNEDFNEVGTIPAKAVTSFDAATANKDDYYLGDATFRYSNKINIDGGAKASGFGMYNLSALVNLKVTGNSGGKIDRIVLRSKKEQLLEQANLAADKIVAGKKGQELYTDTKGTKTIVATLANPDGATTSPDHPVSTYITALPATVEDLEVYVHREDGKWATKTIGSFEFKPNNAQAIKIDVKASDFTAQYFAVDEASLTAALTEAGGATTTIEVIGDITLENNLSIDKPNLTIKGDKIIVPEDITLDVKVKEMKSDIDVLGKACCGAANYGGRLIINGGTFSNITMVPAEATVTAATYDDYNPYVTYNGAATIAAKKTFDAKAGNVDVNDAVAHKGNINIAEGVTLTVYNPNGDLNFMGSKVVNDGTIEVMRDAKFDITDKNGDASAEDGKNMTNNGTFIHNVDAQVGTAVQLMNQNGEYRCRVNKQIKLDDAYQKWTACSVIEIIDAGQIYDLGVAEKNINYQHNGKYIDIEVNTTGATTFNNPDLGSGDGDNKNIQVGNLTVMQGGLYVPFTTGKGNRELTVKGDLTVSACNLSLYSSKKITVTEDLSVSDGAILKFAGKKQNVEGLAVGKDITVSGATFDAHSVDALNITCANFTLNDGATAVFGNRTEGDTKNLTVSGTISNQKATSTFNIIPANQEPGTVLATITCTKLLVGGKFPGGKPQVVAK